MISINQWYLACYNLLFQTRCCWKHRSRQKANEKMTPLCGLARNDVKRVQGWQPWLPRVVPSINTLFNYDCRAWKLIKTGHLLKASRQRASAQPLGFYCGGKIAICSNILLIRLCIACSCVRSDIAKSLSWFMRDLEFLFDSLKTCLFLCSSRRNHFLPSGDYYTYVYILYFTIQSYIFQIMQHTFARVWY